MGFGSSLISANNNINNNIFQLLIQNGIKQQNSLFRSLFKFSTSLLKLRCYPYQECSDFLPWLEREAGREVSSVLSIGKSPYGRLLFATKVLQPGDCLLKIPYHVQISPENLIPEVSSLLPDEVGEVARLAVVLLAEQRKGQHSKWVPYISGLPEVGEMYNTIFWSKTELEMIRKSYIYSETIENNAQIKKSFSTVKPALDRNPETFGVTFEGFQHAYAVVESRAWRSTRGVSLIPFADFVNHDCLSDSLVLSDEEQELSEVIADRVYVPGDQVFISYGKFSNATLLLDFGFTLTHNIYDEVKIQINIPDCDPLRSEKLKVLHAHHSPRIRENNNSFCSSLNVFTIKEVRSIEGKGRGIPQSLRAYCRVLCSTSSQELKEMTDEAMYSDGRLARYPMKNKSREIEAHQFLLSRIDKLIEEYNCIIELLEPSSPICMIEQCNRKRKMALDLLIGEFRVLKSAAQWLKNYCAKLQEC